MTILTGGKNMKNDIDNEIDFLWAERKAEIEAEEEPLDELYPECTCEHSDCICPMHNENE